MFHYMNLCPESLENVCFEFRAFFGQVFLCHHGHGGRHGRGQIYSVDIPAPVTLKLS